MILVAIFDKLIKQISNITTTNNINGFLRDFKSFIKDDKLLQSKIDDLEIYEIATINTETMEVTPIKINKIIEAKNLVTNEPNK